MVVAGLFLQLSLAYRALGRHGRAGECLARARVVYCLVPGAGHPLCTEDYPELLGEVPDR